MTTSYFAHIKGKTGNFVSIAGKTPDGFTGRIYHDLAPKYSWWKEWKDNGLSEEWYKEKYYETVLNKLDAKKVYEDLGEDAILICYERPEKFCHRHLVAEWLHNQLGIDIKEEE